MPWTELQRRSDETTDSCWCQGPLARGPQLRADEESQNERPRAQCPQPAEVTGLRETTEWQRALSGDHTAPNNLLTEGAMRGLSCGGPRRRKLKTNAEKWNSMKREPCVKSCGRLWRIRRSVHQLADHFVFNTLKRWQCKPSYLHLQPQ